MCSMMECVKYSRCQSLCPIHYEVMVPDPDVTALTRLGNPTTIRSHHYSCARTACRLNYSPDLGYFSLEETTTIGMLHGRRAYEFDGVPPRCYASSNTNL